MSVPRSTSAEPAARAKPGAEPRLGAAVESPEPAGTFVDAPDQLLLLSVVDGAARSALPNDPVKMLLTIVTWALPEGATLTASAPGVKENVLDASTMSTVW